MRARAATCTAPQHGHRRWRAWAAAPRSGPPPTAARSAGPAARRTRGGRLRRLVQGQVVSQRVAPPPVHQLRRRVALQARGGGGCGGRRWRAVRGAQSGRPSRSPPALPFVPACRASTARPHSALVVSCSCSPSTVTATSGRACLMRRAEVRPITAGTHHALAAAAAAACCRRRCGDAVGMPARCRDSLLLLSGSTVGAGAVQGAGFGRPAAWGRLWS